MLAWPRSLVHRLSPSEVVPAHPGGIVELAVSAAGREAESFFAIGVVAAGTVEERRRYDVSALPASANRRVRIGLDHQLGLIELERRRR